MNLDLRTYRHWIVGGEYRAATFWKALDLLCNPGDRIVIGSYWMLPELRKEIRGRSLPALAAPPYLESFRFNLNEYPDGAAHELPCDRATIDLLVHMSAIANGGVEKPLFFDHVVAYRPGSPIVPLLSYHDAFCGGWLELSGLYAQQAVHAFVTTLGQGARYLDRVDDKTVPDLHGPHWCKWPENAGKHIT
jgi:hypothetical protein